MNSKRAAMGRGMKSATIHGQGTAPKQGLKTIPKQGFKAIPKQGLRTVTEPGQKIMPKRGLKTIPEGGPDTATKKPTSPNEDIRSEIAAGIESLNSIRRGLGRNPKAIYTYLSAVYGIAAQLRNLGREVVLEAISSISAKPLDRRLAKSPTRLLLAATCSSDSKMQSRYANALQYAKRHECSVLDLQRFIESNGGIQACARAWSRSNASEA